MAQYSIYEGHMDELMKKVARIERKCAKYGCDFHFAQVGEEYRDIKDTAGKVVHTLRFVTVEAEGKAVINGWEFVASVDHTESGNIIRKGLQDIDVPERYYTADPVCDHCHSDRRRVHTFIIRNTETGEFKQVGRACLKDYTNGMDADAAAFMASIRDIFAEYTERDCDFIGGGYHVYYDVEDFLQHAAEIIAHFGYAKTRDEYGDINPDSTKTRTLDFMAHPHKDTYDGFKADTDANIALVRDAVAWLDTQDANSEFMHNLKVIVTNGYCDYKTCGIVAALIPTYQKAVEVETKKAVERAAGAKSEHVGNVGDRITVAIKSAACVTSYETMYGTTYIYKFVDDNGNVLVWKSSKCLDIVGAEYKTITGTVKAHGDYNGTKQTELTRCKVA